jgi:peroxiredoxin Q/BCP
VVWTLRGVFKYVFRGVKMLKVGDPAPEFEVKDHHGRTVRLSDLRGSKVVLWFYPKADTPG